MGPEEIEDIIAEVTHEELARALTGELARHMVAAGSKLYQTMRVARSFSLLDNAAAEFLERYAAERVVGIMLPTTRNALRDTLVAGFREGESTAQLVDRILAAFEGADASRARKIAETEVTIAQGVSTQAAMEDAGVERKQWLATMDGHTRPTHRQLHGQVVDVDKPFVSPSGALAMHPGGFGRPEEDIYCRCAAIPLLPGEQGPEDWPDFPVGKARPRRPPPPMARARAMVTLRDWGVRRVERAVQAALRAEAERVVAKVAPGAREPTKARATSYHHCADRAPPRPLPELTCAAAAIADVVTRARLQRAPIVWHAWAMEVRDAGQ